MKIFLMALVAGALVAPLQVQALDVSDAQIEHSVLDDGTMLVPPERVRWTYQVGEVSLSELLNGGARLRLVSDRQLDVKEPELVVTLHLPDDVVERTGRKLVAESWRVKLIEADPGVWELEARGRHKVKGLDLAPWTVLPRVDLRFEIQTRHLSLVERKSTTASWEVSGALIVAGETYGSKGMRFQTSIAPSRYERLSK